MKALKKRFGENLKELRKERGFKTQESLSEVLGTTQATVARWESGRFSPDPYFLKELCKILRVSEDELTGANHLAPAPTLEALTKIIKDQEGRIKELSSRKVNHDQVAQRLIELYGEEGLKTILNPSTGQLGLIKSTLKAGKRPRSSEDAG